MLDHAYDLGEELTRKAGEAYSWLDNEHKRGQLTDNTVYNALIAMDMVLNGLIPGEYSKWAREKRESVSHAEPNKTQVWLSPDKVVVLTLHRLKAEVEVTMIPRDYAQKTSTKHLSEESCPDPHRWAEQRFETLEGSLIRKGFTRL